MLCSLVAWQVFEALTPIAPKGFSIAAAFGNVHGVYSPGNVKLTPPVSVPCFLF